MKRDVRAWLPPLLVVALLTASVLLWVTAASSSKEADLAANAVAGGIVALAILVLDRSLNRSRERQANISLLATSTELRGMRLPRADLHAAYASRDDLSDCVFSGSDLRDARLDETRCWHTDFSRCDLRGADLRWADLTQVNLGNADLRSTQLGATALTGANLADADLRGADLFERSAGSPYHGADLSGSALFGADLRGVALIVRDRAHEDHTVRVALEDAWANGDTKWPDGFDPLAAGVNVLPGRERHAHDYYVAFRDPGYEDVTATCDPAEAKVYPYQRSSQR
jgi:uncharacterized protein YjbI with pentapeptide repeats